jgi:hypothetical protein
MCREDHDAPVDKALMSAKAAVPECRTGAAIRRKRANWGVSEALRRLVFGLFAVSLMIGVASPAASEAVDRSLIGHWEFKEGAGDIVKDSSGERNDGRILPPRTSEQTWGKGAFANSVSFSGDNDHFIRVPPSASLNSLKSQITVVALIYPRTLWTPFDLHIVSLRHRWEKAVATVEKLVGVDASIKRNEGPNLTGYIAVVQRQWRETMHPDQYFLGYGPSHNVLHYKWHIGVFPKEASLYYLPKGQSKPRAGEWVQLVGTYNGDTGKMSLYVDGELIATETHVGKIPLDQESLNRPLTIGAELNGPSIDEPSGEFDGYIRDVRIYNRALSDAEVKVLAKQALSQVRN